MAFALLPALLLLTASPVAGSPGGDLDQTFGVGGLVTTDFGGADRGAAVAVQIDGKIVAAGTSDNDFAVVRYNVDGNPDLTFGTGGTVITDLGGGDQCRAVAIQSDGKIVAAGTFAGYFALARYQADGSQGRCGAGWRRHGGRDQALPEGMGVRSKGFGHTGEAARRRRTRR
ncbi:MAG TPA: delta-60 repeat domain-containing protein [SAR202 cluster bacterium]|nr:delta-60 repeat domain-containing protein [SAR202 cluster bacterium]